MNFFDVLLTTLKTEKVNTAIFASLAIILLGYYCRKRNIFNEGTAKVLTKVVLSVSIPALSFKSFMADINPETFKNGLGVLIWGLLIYVLLIFLTIPLFAKFKGDEKDTLRVLSIFGSTTFFGIPIVAAIYGAEGALYAAIFNIGYRVFLYSYAYIKMSGLSMKAENIKKMILSPVIIATVLGIVIWLGQSYLPQVMVTTPDKTGEMVQKSYAFLRIDKTLPQLQQVLTYLASLASPLAWLAIGSTLGSISFKEAIEDKKTWYYTLVKLMIIPAFNIVCLIALKFVGFPVNLVALGTTAIMMATPPATVAVSYAISFDKDPLLASNTSLLSTLAAVIMAPVWIVIIQIIGNLNIF